MVDCIGDFNDFAFIGSIADDLMKRHNAEYIYFYETGLNDELLTQAGFINVDTTSNIIPHYFTPYVAKNIEIHYFTTDEKVVLFYGDGDLDKPS